MTIRVLVNGAQGRMGQIAIQAISQQADFSLVGQTGRQDNLAHAIKQYHAQVVVDFTQPDAALQNTRTILDCGANPVIGTTGLLPEQIHTLQQHSKALRRGGIIAPNFSIAAVLMIKYAREIAHYYPHVEIIEMHHDGKLDSPSGTALYTAEQLATNLSAECLSTSKARETIPGARGASHHHVPIHAVRLPGLVAHQQIIFGGQGETLTLRHDAIDRQCFMGGIVLACRKVQGLTELVYGLECIMNKL
ncbi:MAG: 4-hydroxy-tetrahydrodipicolinate reductase [Gammaproteobacteria bacterium RIFCSPHIGHO2_12_FULL_41_20]|nr:MAG: 4-hydroxy-tetrahydrodipicolinate reductase [Gammaproteobacteria bacterium RIFCSPHIGHO2_12_FULL_41_20]